MSTASESFSHQRPSPWLEQDRGKKLKQYAMANPLKFVAISTFTACSFIPILAFLCFAVGTLIATIIAGVLWELFVLFLGVLALAAVLSVVICLSTCITAAAAVVYGFLQVTKTSLGMAKAVVPSTFRTKSGGIPNNSLSEEALSKQD